VSGVGNDIYIYSAKYIYPYKLLFAFDISTYPYGLGILDLNGLQIQYKTFNLQQEPEDSYYYLVPISDTEVILYTYYNAYYVSSDGTMNKLPITFNSAPTMTINKYIITWDFDQNWNLYYTLYELDYKSGTLIKVMDIPKGFYVFNVTLACTITPSTGPQFCDQSAAFMLVDSNYQAYLLYYNIDKSAFDIMPLGVTGVTKYERLYSTPPFRHFKYQNIFVADKYIIDVNAKRVYDVYDLINRQWPLDANDVVEGRTLSVVQNPDSLQVAFVAMQQQPQPPQPPQEQSPPQEQLMAIRRRI
jgi:hypothetical protein